MRTLLIALPVAALGLLGCPSEKKDEALPPAGLAGAPGAPGGLALPGAGHNVADPSGTANPSSGQLPPGHPPIPGSEPAAPSNPHAGGAGGMPAGHPPMPGPTEPSANNPAGAQITGTVAEILEVPEYTYMRLKTSGGEEWVAVSRTTVAVGDSVTVTNELLMEDFPSRQLNRTFPKLVMGRLVGAPKKP